MTNKEFIENLKSNGIYYCKECNLKGCETCEKERNAQFDSVIKDLEVLEILKKYIRAGQWSNEYTLLSWKMKSKELTKIKEWLKNGSNDR